jgi:hypothetical protein
MENRIQNGLDKLKLIREEESSICLSIADDMALLIADPLAAV